MRILVIGGTGHVGSFLVPRLHAAGHEVVVLTRGRSRPYVEHAAWDEVRTVVCDRRALEAAGTFGTQVASIGADVVVDLTCFTPASARQLVDALDGQHLVHTGSIWAYGRSTVVPTTEQTPKRPYGTYGVDKAAVEDYLLRDQQRVDATVLHPGHISGPGWTPINPAGNLDLGVFRDLIEHGRALLPDRGMELLQHVHAADVAGLHLAVIEQRAASTGEAFNVVAQESLSLRGYAELLATDYGHELQLELAVWPEFESRVGAENAAVTADHVGHSPHVSVVKADRLLGWQPAHSAWDTVREAVHRLVDDGAL